MSLTRCVLVMSLLSSVMIISCGSDPTEPVQNVSVTGSVIVQQGLLDSEWTLETVRGSDGLYRPLPLDSTWVLNFHSNGRIGGYALCNAGSGSWQADGNTLNIFDWSEDGAYCSVSETIPSVTKDAVARLFRNETVMPRIEAGRLYLDTGDSTQLVFSERSKRDSERAVSFETLVRSGGFSRASDGNPVFGDITTQYVVYRNSASLNAAYAALPVEGNPWPALPIIDFANNIVVGAYLPLDGQVSSDVVVRGAHIAETGLEIEFAQFSPNIPDEAMAVCAAGDALTAPWTLVRIESVVEPVSFIEMSRAFCSGIPARD